MESGADVFFVLIGAVMVMATQAGFALREAGTVRKKNQVNALMKILAGFAVSIVTYFFVGYFVAYQVGLAADSEVFAKANGYELVKFFLLMTFAATVPAIISGGIAERARFLPQLIATAVLVGLVYPFYEGIVWNNNFGVQNLIKASFGEPFHDFAGSVVVHVVGGWIALAAVMQLGPRLGRYRRDGRVQPILSSNIPYQALGSWTLALGWFGFNVMSAQQVADISGLVAVNALMAMAGGVLSALLIGRNDPGFVHNGALAGLVAVSAGADVMHPTGSLIVGAIAGGLFVWTFTLCQQKWKIDDVLGVWSLHGLSGAWGGIAVGIFGSTALSGQGGVSFWAQVIGTAGGIAIALIGGFVVYGLLKQSIGIRLTKEEENMGADLAIHKIGANPEEEKQN
ncbi:MAG: ammonium transporter [Acidiferrobacterales bacterium]